LDHLWVEDELPVLVPTAHDDTTIDVDQYTSNICIPADDSMYTDENPRLLFYMTNQQDQPTLIGHTKPKHQPYPTFSYTPVSQAKVLKSKTWYLQMGACINVQLNDLHKHVMYHPNLNGTPLDTLTSKYKPTYTNNGLALIPLKLIPEHIASTWTSVSCKSPTRSTVNTTKHNIMPLSLLMATHPI
jgi:hypothetical protein